MALTKIGKEGITGVSNASNATFLTATSGEGVTLAGTLAVTGVHTVGENAIYDSEGGAVTQNLVQGLAKSWINFNGSGTIASRDTHNVASIVDNGTGSFAVNFTSALGNTNYSTITAGNQGASDLDARQGPGAIPQSTSQVGIYCGFDNGAGTDWAHVYDAVFGDLA